MNARRALVWIGIMMLVAASAACLLQGPTSAQGAATPTVEPAAAEPTLPVATAEPTAEATEETSAPDADGGSEPTAEPTQEPSGSETVPADAERITFDAGATAATLEGELAARETDAYVMRVAAGQLIDVTVTGDPEAQLVITGADGMPLKNTMSEGAFFRGVVPLTQDYVVEVLAGDAPTSYTMSVLIPERITFEEEATSTVVEGDLPAHGSHAYVLNVEAGQLIEVSTSPPDGLQLVIYGLDGTVLRSGMGEGAFFRGVVPGGQDYILQISTAADAMPYTMSVMVPERITFEEGGVSADLSGEVAAFHSHAYVIRALAGQTMQVHVTADADVQTSIYGADGEVLKSGMGGGPDFEGTLPSDQDYIIQVRAADQAIAYEATVTVE